MEITRHFTATVLIVYGDRVLLHRHKKRGILLPVGGHLERDELPQEAAIREAREEAGLEIALVDTDAGTAGAAPEYADARRLIRPAQLLLIDMNPYHQHIDCIYYARAASDRVQPAPGESAEWHWYSREDVVAAAMPDNVRALALDALARLGTDAPHHGQGAAHE